MNGFNWRALWENKGRLATQDLIELDGFENTRIQPRRVAEKIKELLGIGDQDLVLELGCGAGMIAQYLNCRYLGIDYSQPLLKKMMQIVGETVLNAEARYIPLKDKSMDKSYAFSVFHYFPDVNYATDVLKELKRVTRNAILVGDIPVKSHSPDHLCYDPSFFAGWSFSEGLYNPDRFNACLRL